MVAYYILLLTTVLLYFLSECQSLILSHTSPCLYPIYREIHSCGVQDTNILDGLACDPDSVSSMSEMHLIGETLRRIYRTNQDKCACPNSISQQCWYKFGFAFVREISPVEGGELCPFNASVRRVPIHGPPEAVLHYGQNYAKIVRERWDFAECGEDVLILVVQRRPSSLNSPGTEPRPYIFISYGSLVQEKLTTLETYAHTFSRFQRIIAEENAHLQDGYPLNRVLTSLVKQIVDIIKKAEEVPKLPQQKSHVPFWAWMVFSACAVLCVLMGIGLCWIRSTTRRGSQRGKPSMSNTGRSWKSDDAAPATNVNLVQMLFPHPRSAANV